MIGWVVATPSIMLTDSTQRNFFPSANTALSARTRRRGGAAAHLSSSILYIRFSLYHRMNVILTWPTRFAATMAPITPSRGTSASMGSSLTMHTQSPTAHRFVDLVLESIEVMPMRRRFGISDSVSPREPAGNVMLYFLSCFLTVYFCGGREGEAMRVFANVRAAAVALGGAFANVVLPARALILWCGVRLHASRARTALANAAERAARLEQRGERLAGVEADLAEREDEQVDW